MTPHRLRPSLLKCLHSQGSTLTFTLASLVATVRLDVNWSSIENLSGLPRERQNYGDRWLPFDFV